MRVSRVAGEALVRLTVDIVVLAVHLGQLHALLIQRAIPPQRGWWALPGGFMRAGETLEQAATRELGEETGVDNAYLEQLAAFGGLHRDPRGRIVTVAYFALLPSAAPPTASTDAAHAQWWPVDRCPNLAFDHQAILALAVKQLRRSIGNGPLGFRLLPKRFTLSQLQGIHEAVLGHALDKRNFRRKLGLIPGLRPTREWFHDGPSRPARVYRFRAPRTTATSGAVPPTDRGTTA